jgi:hypothetical protein
MVPNLKSGANCCPQPACDRQMIFSCTSSLQKLHGSVCGWTSVVPTTTAAAVLNAHQPCIFSLVSHSGTILSRHAGRLDTCNRQKIFSCGNRQTLQVSVCSNHHIAPPISRFFSRAKMRISSASTGLHGAEARIGCETPYPATEKCNAVAPVCRQLTHGSVCD